MKATCAYSGVAFSCQYFPAAVSSSELVHPIFYLKPARLLEYLPAWAAGELAEVDSYLLFLSLLASTEQVEWRLPVLRTATTSQQVANNMERLGSLVSRMQQIPNKKEVLPHFSIAQDSRDLGNIRDWLLVWEQAMAEYGTGYRSTSQRQHQRDAETQLEKAIKDVTRDPASYSRVLASWADLAGNFPRFLTPTPAGSKLPLNVYWKQLITRCCLHDSIFTVAQADLQELIEHCEQEIPHGSIYAYKLMQVLRDTAREQQDFFGDMSISYPALSPDSSVEDANKVALMATAPAELPARHQYPSLVGYLRAKIAWDMVAARTAAKPTSTDSNDEGGN